MKMGINRIKVVKRIRKEVVKIEELAMDIIENGLLNPVTVMEMPDGEYQLLAGLRWLKAVEELGCDEIDVNIVTPANAEAALCIEISEKDREAVRKIKEFNAMSPEEKIEELRRQLKFERTRATIAESELARLKEFHHNAVYHKDGIIDNLRFRLESSDEQLTEAFTQMQKCEHCKNHVPQTSAV